jgi:hypothetical protein
MVVHGRGGPARGHGPYDTCGLARGVRGGPAQGLGPYGSYGLARGLGPYDLWTVDNSRILVLDVEQAVQRNVQGSSNSEGDTV